MSCARLGLPSAPRQGSDLPFGKPCSASERRVDQVDRVVDQRPGVGVENDAVAIEPEQPTEVAVSWTDTPSEDVGAVLFSVRPLDMP